MIKTMYRIATAKKSLIVSLIAFLFILVTSQTLFGKNFYFSTSGGDDTRTSTQAQNSATPWKTISKLNTFFTSLAAGDSVLFKRGEIFYGAIIVKKSGTASLPIVIGSYGTGNNPVISGFTTLTSWTSIGNGVYQSAATACKPTLNVVTVNGVQKTIGRYPNTGYLTYESHSGTTSITDNQLTSTTNWTGAEVVIRRNFWTLSRGTITNHSANTLTYSGGLDEPWNNYGYFVQGNTKTLDLLGEWYFEPTGKNIQMYFGSSNPSSLITKASTLDTLVRSKNYSYLTFTNLNFEGANVSAFYINDGQNISVLNCGINFTGGTGIYTSNINFRLENCVINNSNDVALWLNCPNSVIRHNTIKNTGLKPGMGVSYTAIETEAYGTGTIIEYNKIDSSGYCGIKVSGNDKIVKNNLINYFCLTKSDGGGIFLSGTNYTGIKINGNIILNGKGIADGTDDINRQMAEGIYLDEPTSSIEITNNTVASCARAGIYLHDAHDNIIRENLLYNNQYQIRLVRNNRFPNDNIRNNSIIYNIFFSKSSTQYTWSSGSVYNDIPLFGTSDNNYFCRPVDDNLTIQTEDPVNGYKIRSHDGWKSFTGQDPNSKKSPQAITNENDILFEYNASLVNRVIPLNAVYLGVDGAVYSNSFTLLPYKSVVLIKSSNQNINLNQPPVIQDQSFQISNSSVNGSTVGNVVATDPNAGQTLTYSILSGNTNDAFAINASTGVITVANSNSLVNGTDGSNYSLFQSVAPSGSSTNFIGNGTAPLEVGMKFSSNVDGYISGFRFYKGVGSQGIHIGNLWSINGVKLASATFTNETASGWQTVTLSAPVAIKANTIYVVSYFSQHGDFVSTSSYFTSVVVNGPLTGLGWTSSQPNGVYIYNATSSFPNNNAYIGSSNYWADVLFSSAPASSSSSSLFQSTPSNSSTNFIGNGTAPLEVGMKFTTNVDGYISGFRFYKGVGGQGTHIGNLWSINGTNLASATFTGETASGWQTVALSTPVAIKANTIYVVSYFSQHGDYVSTSSYFTSGIVNGPLTGLGWTATQPNGIYRYTSTSAFPNNNAYIGSTNYWADVIFSSNSISTSISTTSNSTSTFALGVKVQDNGTGNLSNQATISINLNLNTANQPPFINNQSFSVSGNSPNGTVVGSVIASDPDAGQTITYSILSGNTNGAFVVNASNGVITVANANALANTNYSVFQSVTPSGSSTNYIGNGSAPLEVGMKFSSNIDGYISGFRFYKGVGSQGTHIGNLWGINGTNLASATFTNETASGWQTVTLSTPVAIKANTIYVVSYFSQHGDYVSTSSYFTSNIVNGPLTGLGWTASQPNGVYKYNTTSAFPNNNAYIGNSNYWADVIFSSSPSSSPSSYSLAVKVQDNGTGSLSNQATISIDLNLNAANKPPVISNQSFSVSGNSPNGTVVGSVIASDPDAGQTLSYSILSGNSNNTFAVNASNGVITVANANALANTSYSIFQSVMPSGSATNYIGNGSAPLEVGMKFSSNIDGYISGFRFYKGVGSQGTHIGNLWSIDGTNLASATFTNETTSGWQTVALSTPVAIKANTIYVVSYFSQHGDYVSTSSFFTSDIVNGPLTGLGWTASQPNGLYRYASTSVFPNNNTYVGSSNYWADVIFYSTLPPTSFSLGISVRDNGTGNLSSQAAITIKVNTVKSANTLIITSIPQDTVSVGSSYTYKVLGLSGNESAINYTVDDLPYWLSIADNGNGTSTIEGKPSIEDIGLYQLILKGRNSIQEVQQVFTIEVKSNLLKEISNQKAPIMHIYPNPVTNDILNVKLNEQINEQFMLSIWDMSGKLLLEKQYEHVRSLSLDISGYPPETYLIQIRSRNFQISDKFIKN